jgi:hypothetical protein
MKEGEESGTSSSVNELIIVENWFEELQRIAPMEGAAGVAPARYFAGERPDFSLQVDFRKPYARRPKVSRVKQVVS